MAKPEWGKKRTCQSCSARFYDLMKDPITCPKCEAVFDPLASLRPRRSRVAAAKAETKAAAKPTPAPKPKPEPEADADAEAETDELETATDEDVAVEEDDEESLIEDASELGEDEDDVGPVAVSDDDC